MDFPPLDHLTAGLPGACYRPQGYRAASNRAAKSADVDPLSAGPDHPAAAQALAAGIDVGCSIWAVALQGRRRQARGGGG
jgi:hypothetical protein